MFTIFPLLALICRREKGRKDIFPTKFELFGNCLAFDAWA